VTSERIEQRRTDVLAGRVDGARGAPLTRDALRRELVLLGAIMRLARKRRWISHNPMDAVDAVHPPARSEDFNVLSTEQVEAVARAAHEDWEAVEPGKRKRTSVPEEHAARLTAVRKESASTYAALIRFAAYTGLRLGELRALRWRDIDWTGAVVHVRRNAPTSAPAGEKEKAPKSGRARTVPLSDAAARTAEALSRRGQWTQPGDRVFPSPSGEAIDDGKVRDAFYAALAAAGLGAMREKDEPITFHDLRHSFGTTCAVAGIPEVTIQSWMGHADGSTTKRYMHHAPRHDDARRLSAAQVSGASGARST
jgi:integrase